MRIPPFTSPAPCVSPYLFFLLSLQSDFLKKMFSFIQSTFSLQLTPLGLPSYGSSGRWVPSCSVWLIKWHSLSSPELTSWQQSSQFPPPPLWPKVLVHSVMLYSVGIFSSLHSASCFLWTQWLKAICRHFSHICSNTTSLNHCCPVDMAIYSSTSEILPLPLTNYMNMSVLRHLLIFETVLQPRARVLL